ncbi:NlpC/P60 family protein [Actinosynnema sp. NPDC023587]|uniref:NlpC/P60 family protein n=1 Tax=Actinosynnema sp. NPDC023587 TaxID=3154695 RepID=UPI0033F22734
MTRLLAAAIGAVTALTLVSPTAHAEPLYGGQGPERAATSNDATRAAPITRREVIARAKDWLDPPVPYSMGAWHEGRRTDCSGYVSMAWNLDSSMTTVSLPDVAHRIEKDELRAGDVMMNGGPGSGGANGHVAIFDRWAGHDHDTYWAYEQTPPHTVHRKVPYPYFDNDTRFLPYRYNLIEDSPFPQRP